MVVFGLNPEKAEERVSIFQSLKAVPEFKFYWLRCEVVVLFWKELWVLMAYKILIVEDNPDQLELMRITFSKKSNKFSTTFSYVGKECIK